MAHLAAKVTHLNQKLKDARSASTQLEEPMADESAAPKKQRTVRSVAPITLQAAVVRRPVAFPPGTKDSFIAPMLRFPETSWRDQDINGGRFITLCTL
jgi:hypothetical protein